MPDSDYIYGMFGSVTSNLLGVDQMEGRSVWVLNCGAVLAKFFFGFGFRFRCIYRACCNCFRGYLEDVWKCDVQFVGGWSNGRSESLSLKLELNLNVGPSKVLRRKGTDRISIQLGKVHFGKILFGKVLGRKGTDRIWIQSGKIHFQKVLCIKGRDRIWIVLVLPNVDLW